MSSSEFEVELSGGHPNSLGNTEAVVARVREDENLLDELISTYSSEDEVVRLRVSSAIKRVTLSHPHWVKRRLKEIEWWVDVLAQPSAQWSLSQDYLELSPLLSDHQRRGAIERMKGFLSSSNDWIVINHTLETLGQWARQDPSLRDWLVPRLHHYAREPRKSIAVRAHRHLAVLDYP